MRRELLHQGHVPGGGEAERPRPLREGARRLGDPERGRGPVVVARVRHEEDRGAEPPAFRHLLHGVRPRRHRPRVGVLPVDELDDVPLRDRVRRARRDHRGRPAGEGVDPVDGVLAHRAARAHRQGGADHEPRLLLERHLPDEVVHALGDGTPPVLVGVQLPVLVEVLEEKALHPQDLDDSGADLGLRERRPLCPGFGEPRPGSTEKQTHAGRRPRGHAWGLILS